MGVGLFIFEGLKLNSFLYDLGFVFSVVWVFLELWLFFGFFIFRINFF